MRILPLIASLMLIASQAVASDWYISQSSPFTDDDIEETECRYLRMDSDDSDGVYSPALDTQAIANAQFTYTANDGTGNAANITLKTCGSPTVEGSCTDFLADTDGDNAANVITTDEDIQFLAATQSYIRVLINTAPTGNSTSILAVCGSNSVLPLVESDPLFRAEDTEAEIEARLGIDILKAGDGLNHGDGTNSLDGFAIRGVDNNGNAQDAFDVATQVELDAHMGLPNDHHVPTVDTNADTLCTGSNVFLDGDGNCDVILSGELVDDLTPSLSGTLDGQGNSIVNVGAVDGVDISAHALSANAHHTPTIDTDDQDASEVDFTTGATGLSGTNLQDIVVELDTAIDALVAQGVFTPNADISVDYPVYVAGHGDGTDCPVGQYARGTDASGNATGCTTDATGGAGGGINNVVEDTTPELGGDLDMNSNDITEPGLYGGRDLLADMDQLDALGGSYPIVNYSTGSDSEGLVEAFAQCDTDGGGTVVLPRGATTIDGDDFVSTVVTVNGSTCNLIGHGSDNRLADDNLEGGSYIRMINSDGTVLFDILEDSVRLQNFGIILEDGDASTTAIKCGNGTGSAASDLLIESVVMTTDQATLAGGIGTGINFDACLKSTVRDSSTYGFATSVEFGDDNNASVFQNNSFRSGLLGMRIDGDTSNLVFSGNTVEGNVRGLLITTNAASGIYRFYGNHWEQNQDDAGERYNVKIEGDSSTVHFFGDFFTGTGMPDNRDIWRTVAKNRARGEDSCDGCRMTNGAEYASGGGPGLSISGLHQEPGVVADSMEAAFIGSIHGVDVLQHDDDCIDLLEDGPYLRGSTCTQVANGTRYLLTPAGAIVEDSLSQFYVTNYEPNFARYGLALAAAITDCKAAGGGIVYLHSDGVQRTVTDEDRATIPALGACSISGSGYSNMNSSYPYAEGATTIEVGGDGLTSASGPLFVVDKSGIFLRNFALTLYEPTANGIGIQIGDYAEATSTSQNDTRTGALNNVTIDDVYIRGWEGWVGGVQGGTLNTPLGTGLVLDDALKSQFSNLLVEGFDTGILMRGVTAATSVQNSQVRLAESCGISVDDYASFRILYLSDMTYESNFRGLCVQEGAYGLVSEQQGYYENGFRGTLADRANIWFQSASSSYHGSDIRFTGGANIPTGRDFVAEAGLDDNDGLSNAGDGIAQSAHTIENVRFNNGTTITGANNRMQVSHVSRTAIDATFLPVGSVYGGVTHFRHNDDCQSYLESLDTAFLGDFCTEEDDSDLWRVTVVDGTTGRGTGSITLTQIGGGGSAGPATTTSAGIVELATAGETNTGTATTTAVTPFAIGNWAGSSNLSIFQDTGVVAGSYTNPILTVGADGRLTHVTNGGNPSSTIASGVFVPPTSQISANGACTTTQTLAVSGAIASNHTLVASSGMDLSVVAGYTPATTGGLIMYSWLTDDNANFKICNPTSSPITPGTAVFLIKVLQ